MTNSIAKIIKNNSLQDGKVKDYDNLFSTCERLSIEIEQNWEKGKTSYIFEDGSALILQDSEISVQQC